MPQPDIIDAPMVKREDAPLATRAETPTETLIRIALDKGQNPTELYAILRDERADARVQLFANAKWQFLNRVHRIRETKRGGGVTKSGAKFEFPYADMSDIINQAGPDLRDLGFSWGFSLVVLGDGKQYQRCNLRHAGGHLETADVPYIPDTGGHMNVVQQVGSGLSYSERYALLAALGLPTGPDADSRDMQTITEDQARTINDLLIESGADKAKFLAWALPTVARDDRKIADIPAKMFDTACKLLNDKIREKAKGKT